jgi:hypothetical protein
MEKLRIYCCRSGAVCLAKTNLPAALLLLSTLIYRKMMAMLNIYGNIPIRQNKPN